MVVWEGREGKGEGWGSGNQVSPATMGPPASISCLLVLQNKNARTCQNLSMSQSLPKINSLGGTIECLGGKNENRRRERRCSRHEVEKERERERTDGKHVIVAVQAQLWSVFGVSS